MGLVAFTWVLSNWKTEQSSQVLCLKLFTQSLSRSFLLVFKIKLRASIVWHSQVSQYMWYLWILTKTIKMLCLFLFLPLRLYVEFKGKKKARAYLQYIYCKVKQQIQRELSHIIKLRCACVDKWWLYMVPNLILLYSLKTYLFFETWKHLLESRASKYPLF